MIARVPPTQPPTPSQNSPEDGAALRRLIVDKLKSALIKHNWANSIDNVCVKFEKNGTLVVEATFPKDNFAESIANFRQDFSAYVSAYTISKNQDDNISYSIETDHIKPNFIHASITGSNLKLLFQCIEFVWPTPTRALSSRYNPGKG